MVVGKILGVAGKALAKKFMKGVSKVKKHPKTTVAAVATSAFGKKAAEVKSEEIKRFWKEVKSKKD